MPYLVILLLNRMEATEICFDCVKKKHKKSTRDIYTIVSLPHISSEDLGPCWPSQAVPCVS